MYTYHERDKYYRDLVVFIKNINSIHTITRIGSGVIGYNDIHSDIDIMLSCETDENIDETIIQLSKYFEKVGCNYFKVVNFGWILIYAILENDLEFNISLVKKEYTTIMSTQAKVIYSKDLMFKSKLEDDINNLSSKRNSSYIDSNIDFLFLTYIRKYKIAVVRNDFIGAVNALNAARECIIEVQIAKENRKPHQFKQYYELDETFQKEYISTYPCKYNFAELDELHEKIKSLYFLVKVDIDRDVKNYLSKKYNRV